MKKKTIKLKELSALLREQNGRDDKGIVRWERSNIRVALYYFQCILVSSHYLPHMDTKVGQTGNTLRTELDTLNQLSHRKARNDAASINHQTREQSNHFWSHTLELFPPRLHLKPF